MAEEGADDIPLLMRDDGYKAMAAGLTQGCFLPPYLFEMLMSYQRSVRKGATCRSLAVRRVHVGLSAHP